MTIDARVISRSVVTGSSRVYARRRNSIRYASARPPHLAETKRNSQVPGFWSRQRSSRHCSLGLVPLSRASTPSSSPFGFETTSPPPRATIAVFRAGSPSFETSSTRTGEPMASDVQRGRERPPDPLRAVATVLQRPFDVAVEGHAHLLTLVACDRTVRFSETKKRTNERGVVCDAAPADVVVAETSTARVDGASRRPRRVAVEGDGRTSSRCVAFGSASTSIPSTRRRDASRSTWDVATIATPPSRGDTDVATSRDPREEKTMRSNAPVSRTRWRERVGG